MSVSVLGIFRTVIELNDYGEASRITQSLYREQLQSLFMIIGLSALLIADYLQTKGGYVGIRMFPWSERPLLVSLTRQTVLKHFPCKRCSASVISLSARLDPVSLTQFT